MTTKSSTSERPVPMVDLVRAHAPFASELEAAFHRVVDSGRFILGEEVAGFEREAAAYLGVDHAIGVSSGTDALLAVLMALDIGPGDEVICPAYTFFATGGCVARLGARPVFADVSPITYNLEPDLLDGLVTPSTRALVVVHLFGRAADTTALGELVRPHGVAVVEDTAQALGARSHGRLAGTIGDIGSFSFFPTKNLGGFGDGGLVATPDGDLAERVRLLRNHGQEDEYLHSRIGGNFRLDALQAALLRVKLPHLEAFNARRREVARRYRDLLLAAGIAEDPGESEAAPVVLPDHGGEGEHVFHQYVVRIRGRRERDEVRARLAERGVQTAIYYPWPLHLQPCFLAAGRGPGSLPTSERLARETLALPMHPDLLPEEQERVVAALVEACEP